LSAVRDCNPANVRFGSKAPQAFRPDRGSMSAVPPKADIAYISISLRIPMPCPRRISVPAMPGRADELQVAVTFDPRRGYTAHLPATINALSLQSLRQRAATSLGVGVERIKLKLDRAARKQRDERRSGGAARASDTSGRNAAG